MKLLSGLRKRSWSIGGDKMVEEVWIVCCNDTPKHAFQSRISAQRQVDSYNRMIRDKHSRPDHYWFIPVFLSKDGVEDDT